jgi:uncharacterized membrane protein YukC
MAWNIASKEIADDKTKLQALALINDCNKYKMDLTTNGSLVMDSVKIVQNQLDYLNKTEKKILQQDIKDKNTSSDSDEVLEEEEKDIIEQYQNQQQQQEEQNTTNGIF